MHEGEEIEVNEKIKEEEEVSETNVTMCAISSNPHV